MHRFAGVFVSLEDSILLVNEPDYFTGEPCWTFPSGRIDPGEEPADAASRELAEESGCIVDPGDLELVAIADVEQHGEILNRSWSYAASTTVRALAPRTHAEETVTAAEWIERAEAVRLLGQSSYAPMVEPVIRFLTTGERGLQWTFDLVDSSKPIPTFRWRPPSPGLPG